MDTTTVILIVLAAVLGMLYFVKRSARQKKGTRKGW
jgi:hypothetical protein